MLTLSFTAFAEDNVDIIVTNDGESLKVYNLDYSSADYCYYTNEPNSDDLKRIKKANVLIIKLANGTKVDPTATPQRDTSDFIPAIPGLSLPKHEIVTFTTDNEFDTDKKGNKIIKIADNNGNILCYRLVSDTEKVLAVTKPLKGIKYEAETYVIPEYIDIKGEKYTVKSIEKEAFKQTVKQNLIGASWRTNIKEIILPETLIEIGDFAFYGNGGLRRIIIPNSVKKIGETVFRGCGVACPTFEQLYIPTTVETIGANAFIAIGPNCSYRGYYQGNLTSIPTFITISNCTNYGIDEEAVEAYLNRNK